MTIALPGYAVEEPIREGRVTRVFRGRRTGDDRPIVLKVLRDPYPDEDQVARLRHEHELLLDLQQVAGVPRVLGFEACGNSPALVVADRGGVPLRSLIVDGALPVAQALDIGLRAAELLAALHERRVVHKNVSPDTLLWNPASEELELVGFGLASRISRETQAAASPGRLEGALGYLSPEQTGRTNRSIDDRSDLYSLGATLFHALTGRPPFIAEDPLELVHCHIAKRPPRACDLRPDLPPVLADVLGRLLAKTPEERYQSAHNLAHDLRRCRDELREAGGIVSFPVGADDISPRFHIPQRLYGREAEIATLLAAYERAAAGARSLLLVSGYAGIGKSALVQELHRPVVATRGFFIAGKFDQLRRNIPYASLIAAAGDLIQQLLAEPEDRIARWRERLLAALAPNAQVVIEAIPAVELILGPQPPVPPLPPLEEQNRFITVFQAFVRVFATAEHPLALFLDDLQWADAPSLDLIERVLSDEGTRHLLVIGAYRDSEVDALHPLRVRLDEMRAEGLPLEEIALGPLSTGDVAELLRDTLHSQEVGPLAEVCVQKTEGNPFFLSRFLLDLYRQQRLRFDLVLRRWRWDVEEIRAMEVAENVVALLVDTIHRLAPRAQHVLTLAACIGSRFEAETLAIVDERTPEQTIGDLWPALEGGLVLPIGDAYKLLQHGKGKAGFRFLHDRVQQAAYTLIDPERQRRTHRRVGRLLLERLDGAALEDRLFEIVDHLNKSAELATDAGEREELAELNLRVGRKAKTSAAYAPALAYLERGMSLLGDDGWTRQPELTLELHVEATEAAYLSRDFQRCDALRRLLLARSPDLLDAVRVHETHIFSLILQNRQIEAVGVALEVLPLLGIKFPARPGKPHIVAGYVEVRRALFGKRIEELADLPAMRDPVQLAAMRIMAGVSSAAYISAPNLLALFVFKQICLTARSGVCSHSAFALATYGMILCGGVGGGLDDIETGYRCGQTALRLVERLGAPDVEARTAFVHAVFIRHWKDPAERTWAACPDLYRRGVETGDLEYAAWAALMRVLYGYAIGKPLREVDVDAEQAVAAARQLRQDGAERYTRIIWQSARNLMGRTADPLRLVGEVYDEEASLPLHLESDDKYAACNVYVEKLMLAYLFGQHRQALQSAERAAELLDGVIALAQVTKFHFFDALTRLALARSAGRLERWSLLQRVRGHLRKFKTWARSSPSNQQHRLELLEAELCGLKGARDAPERYDQAIASARASGYLNDEALASERAGRFHLGQGAATRGQRYLRDAKYAWERWGAAAKVRDLAPLVQPDPAGPAGVEGSLDLTTVLRATRTISGEIVLDRLLERLLRIIVENAGAERGVIVLRGADGPLIEVEGRTEGDEIVVSRRRAPLEMSDHLPQGVIGYVLRTGATELLADASAESRLQGDPYVQRAQPRSLLCAPIVHLNEVRGAVYLENNMIPNAFTPARLEVIDVLAAQAAISIENARLYATLEVKVAERTRELSDKNGELQRTLEKVHAMQDQIVTQQKLASLGALTAGIAHEINNPLNFVNNFSELILEQAEELLDELDDDASPERLRAGVESLLLNAGRIAEHGERARNIVAGMLQHSRSGGSAQEPTDINALLEGALDLIHHATRSEVAGVRVELERELEPGLPPVLASPQELRQAFLNVLDNACHAARERGRAEPDHTPRVRVRTRGRADRVEVEVEDNGPGIPAHLRAQIFEPFFTTRGAGQGTGLGLSITHDLITRLHHGTLSVTSEPGAGSTFTITLPRAASRSGGRT